MTDQNGFVNLVFNMICDKQKFSNGSTLVIEINLFAMCLSVINLIYAFLSFIQIIFNGYTFIDILTVLLIVIFSISMFKFNYNIYIDLTEQNLSENSQQQFLGLQTFFLISFQVFLIINLINVIQKIESSQADHLSSIIVFSLATNLLQNLFLKIIFNIQLAMILNIQYYFNNIDIPLRTHILMLMQFTVYLILITIRNYSTHSKQQEKIERMLETQIAMHDLRNNLQSLIDLNDHRDEILKQMHKDTQNKRVSVQYSQNSELNQSTKDGDQINNHYLDMPTNYKSNSYDNIQADINDQLRLVNWKVCYLQHMELMFNYKQFCKVKLYDCNHLITNINSISAILFINKNINIKFHLFAQTQYIIIDAKVFEQLLVYIINQFTNQIARHFNITININLKDESVILSIVVDSFTTESQENIDNLNQRQIFRRIIEQLNYNIKQAFQYSENRYNIIISLPYTLPESIDQENQDGFRIRRFKSLQNQENEDNNDNLIQNSCFTLESKISQIENNIIEDFIEVKKNNIEQDLVDSQEEEKMPKFDNANNIKIENENDPKDQNERISQSAENDKKTLNVSFEHDLIILNIDDEENILKMNSRIVSKSNYQLNCVKNTNALLEFLSEAAIQAKNINKPMRILLLVDHILDCEYGQEAIKKSQEIFDQSNLNIIQVLLSSTEDIETIEKQIHLNVYDTLVKPLNTKKFKKILHNLSENLDNKEIDVKQKNHYQIQ